MMIKRIAAIVFFTSVWSQSVAQYTVLNEVWLEAGTQAKMNDLSISLAEGFRIHEGSASQTYTELGLQYKVNKYLRFGAGYRFIQKPLLFSIYEYDHRFSFDATLSYKAGHIQFGFRPRYQHRVNGISGDDGSRSKTYSRNKFSVEYSVSKQIGIELNYEFFMRLASGDNFIDQNRYSIQGSYTIDKTHKFSLFYMLQQEIQVTWPQLTHVVGLEYSYNFKLGGDSSTEGK